MDAYSRRRLRLTLALTGGLLLCTMALGARDTMCVPVPIEPIDCPTFVAAQMDCPHALMENACLEARCQEPCSSDVDCLVYSHIGSNYCVVGNCVSCWHDGQCDDGQLCRAGHCVEPPADTDACPAVGECGAGCSMVTLSESPCPVCVCDSLFGRPCSEDLDCQVISSHRFLHCVYGRCAECRTDDECGEGLSCAMPGLCSVTEPDPSALYGLWLVGWYGGLDHFSYLRFEPDGTLRRGAYPEEVAWSDDILSLDCVRETFPPPAPQLGTWEVEVTASMQLAIRIRPNGDCWVDADHPYQHRFSVTVAEDGQSADLWDIDRGGQLMAIRVPMERCAADMSSCESPFWEDVYPPR